MPVRRHTVQVKRAEIGQVIEEGRSQGWQFVTSEELTADMIMLHFEQPLVSPPRPYLLQNVKIAGIPCFTRLLGFGCAVYLGLLALLVLATVGMIVVLAVLGAVVETGGMSSSTPPGVTATP